MVCKEGWGEDRERPYRVESWVVVLTECSQRAVEARVEGGGERARGLGGQGGVVIEFGGGCYWIRILMYRDVSCMYPEGYTYLECIWMYLKCILNALLHSKRIHVS